jgi:radical SAM superfamily enzyme YgiQ (UPF0313 family)
MVEKQNPFSRKILLIKPNYGFFPIGLAYVMADMDRNGIPFDFIDSFFQKVNYKKLFAQNDYLAVATGGLVGDAPFFLELAGRIKKYGESMPFILGGNITQCVNPDILFDRFGIDYAVLGEAETAFAGLLRRLERSEKFFDDLPGVMFRDRKSGTIHRKASLRLNLDSDDREPAWHHLDMEKYLHSCHHSFPGRTFFPVMTGRGCTGHCSFCRPTMGQFRSRKINNILKEMWRMSETYDFSVFGVMTEVLFAHHEEIVEFCRRYSAEGPPKEWFCSLRLDVDPAILKVMKESGCIGVSIGAESGSDKILKRMNKGVNRKTIQTFLHELKATKMPQECNVMVGSEGEGGEDLRETFNLLIEEEMFSNINLTIAYPGTLIYRHAREKKIIEDEYEYLTKLQYIGLDDERIAEKNYLNVSDFPGTEDLHNGIMKEVRRYLGFLSGRFKCDLQLEVAEGGYQYSARCPICKKSSEIGKEFGNWRWDGLVIRLVCPHCFNVSFSRIGSPESVDRLSEALQGVEKVLILGTGMNAKSILAFGLPGFDMNKIIGFVGSGGTPESKKFFFYPQYRLGEIKELKPDLVLITDMYFQDACDLMATENLVNKERLLPLMPDVFPEKLLQNKKILLMGAGRCLHYIMEKLRTIDGCIIAGAVDDKQIGKKNPSGVDILPVSAIFSNDWDVMINISNSRLSNVLLMRLFINKFILRQQKIILERHKHPRLNISLWKPHNYLNRKLLI